MSELGSKPEVSALLEHFRFTLISGHYQAWVRGPKCARNRPRSGKETEHLQRKQLLVGPRLRHRRNTNIPAVTILSRIWTLLVP